MKSLIDAAFSRSRAVLLGLVLLLAVGAAAYRGIPKEAAPEVQIPVAIVTTSLEGISPADSERLLIRPLEAELAALAGLDEMTAQAGEGFASVVLEFEPGSDAEVALDRVREAVDRARSELPSDARTPVVQEINTALFPVLTAVLSGPVPERALNGIADDLKARFEALEGVLEVDIAGARTEVLEVLIDPTVFETYGLSFEELIAQVARNNRLIAAGAIDTRAGRIVLKVPGLIEDIDDVMEMPLKVRGDAVVTFGDVAALRRSYEDPQEFARYDGQPALVLEVTKRVGANIIETVDAVRAEAAAAASEWPETVRIAYPQDQSTEVEDTLSELETNVIAAILLVMIVIIWALGVRSALLVGLAIPGAFLSGVAALWAMGHTMNIIVLFSLILVVGMLVDGAIVVVEYADRKLEGAATPRQAYAAAAKRMAWPIIASVSTTLSVFVPLLFWSGVVGEFMKYLPITVILTLAASLLMALVFVPVVGGALGRRRPQTAHAKRVLHESERGDPRRLRGAAGVYARFLGRALSRPLTVVLVSVAALLAALTAYAQHGTGIAFFPEIEPETLIVEVRSRDNSSVYERDDIVRRVERRLAGREDVESIYARTLLGAEDAEVIGRLTLELTEWDTRAPAKRIGEEIRTAMADIAGIEVQVRTPNMGPTPGKPVNLELRSDDAQVRDAAVEAVHAMMDRIGGFTDVTDTRPLPGVEWRIDVDRSEASRFGADVSLLGQAVQLLTQGVEIAEYRPEDADAPVPIRVRFPAPERTLADLGGLRVPTRAGPVPIGNFVQLEPAPRSGTIRRVDQTRAAIVEADVAPGLLVNDQVAALRAALESEGLPGEAAWSFKGQAEEQQAAMEFLATAFVAAIALMFAIMLLQFNSYYQALVVFTAIVFSVTGVLLGLLVTGRPFGVVMGGIGMIALAGVVVNDNIVLIDTYNRLRAAGQGAREAALRTGVLRMRPVILTSVTTGLGLMPMVLALTVDFYNRDIIHGAPSTQWWTELSSAVVGGLAVSTILTLVVTPALLVLGPGQRAAAGPT
ncbi:efflux RND transporter permease subunit [Roseovarius salinarum]|uniref:efflux RND transporter permease subunit n=1 Tax=Roseovarius salinarum TaxID=1981892 RepID=UPI000C331B8B|nr:efflux RND transporter permease subunit [Roseovarius salinarum]